MQQADGLQRYVYILLAVILTVTALYFGKGLFLMVTVSGLLAFLVLPIARGVERLHAPRWAGSAIATLVVLITVLAFFFLMGWQFKRFGGDLPALRAAFSEKGSRVLLWMEEQTHIERREQMRWFNERLADIADSGGNVAMGLFRTTGSALASIVPIPIFIFLILQLRDKFRVFFEQLGSTGEGSVLDIMTKISMLSRKYLRGVLIVIMILGVLNSIGFLLLGLKYAILLGFAIAFLNIIPYIGVLIGSLLPMIIALLTKDSMMYVLGALGVCLITQFLENNFITPYVVGSSVSLNPLASLIALLAAGMLWGVVGMVLAIPITGMLKIICDAIPSLRPWGFILGEERIYEEHERLPGRFFRTRLGNAQPPART
ncbi:MAG: AI-2E family transporter [Bacteroidota bacterium]|nr:AI-2E family transporter [Bacteroidota bacterium]